MIILAFYLISSVRKITNSVQVIEKEIKEVSDNLTPLISETSEVIKDLAVLSEDLKQDYTKIRPVIADTVTTVREITQTLSKVKNGAGQVTKFLFPVVSGVTTALKFLKK